MKLYLMQHGEALPKEIDPDEPLSPAGIVAVEKTAKAAGKIGVRADRIITSDKHRARQTAEIMAPAVGSEREAIEVSSLVKAMTPPRETVEYLARYSDCGAILVAGHMPSLGAVAGFLLSDGGSPTIQFDRSGICCLEVDTLPTRAARLLWYLPPQLIAVLG